MANYPLLTKLGPEGMGNNAYDINHHDSGFLTSALPDVLMVCKSTRNRQNLGTNLGCVSELREQSS
jgi:hypothetical protein